MKCISKSIDLSNYNQLLSMAKKTRILKSVVGLLRWDQETYMPPQAISCRSEQIALLEVITRNKEASKTYANLLKKLINLKTGKILGITLGPEKKIAVKELHRTYMRLIRLPNSFVEKFATLTSQATHVWATARQEKNFLKFMPVLAQIIEMCQKKAELLKYKKHPYDVLLDEYEPNWTSEEASQLFSALKQPLINIQKSIASKPKIDSSFLIGFFNKNKQLNFSHILLKSMGYDLNCGRLDLSSHPFSIGLHPHDVRLTTSVNILSLVSCIFSVIHEGGHGLYELGLPKEHFGSPLAEAASMGVHESQSRLWETQLGKSLPFWKYFYPLLKKEFPKVLSKISLKQFYSAINKVYPGPIRIEADEITYNLHIIIRYEIEKSLIEGSLAVKDLPDVWNDKMQQYLNVTVKNDAEGCLQDIHWSMGAFGYFPTYTLGNLYAAQLFNTIKNIYPHWEQEVAKGNLTFIREWLRNNIYQYGKRYSTKELIKKATGKELSSNYFIRYLYQKYQDLYS